MTGEVTQLPEMVVTASRIRPPPPVETKPPLSFLQRRISLTLQFGKGDYGTAGFDAHTVTNARVRAEISRAAQPAWSTAMIRVYGLSMDHVNRFVTLNQPMHLGAVRNNLVTVRAGDDTNGLFVVFQGLIKNAWVDFAGMPEVCLVIESYQATIDAVRPVAPTSFKGPADVAAMMAGFAKQMDFSFENNGVAGLVLMNPYYSGTATEQASACAREAGIELSIDNAKTPYPTLAIWPRLGFRSDHAIPLLSPATGMAGYPAYCAEGMTVRTLFNPSLRFGGQVQVKSDVKPACAVFVITRMAHTLEAMTPRGLWVSDMTLRLASLPEGLFG